MSGEREVPPAKRKPLPSVMAGLPGGVRTGRPPGGPPGGGRFGTLRPDGMSIPEELARRADRLQCLAEAKAKIEARARERYEREQAEYRAKIEAREEKAKRTGRKPGGRPPHTNGGNYRPLWAHSLDPMDMIVSGWFMSLFQAWHPASMMAS